MKNILEYLLGKNANNKIKYNDIVVGDIVQIKYAQKTEFLVVKEDESYLYVFHLFKPVEDYTYEDFAMDKCLTSWCKIEDVKEIVAHVDLDEKTLKLFSNISKSK